MWSCHKENLKISKPLANGIPHSHKVEATYDSTVKDLEARIKVSEAQLSMLKKNSVTGPKNLHIMSASEPVQYKAGSPPE